MKSFNEIINKDEYLKRFRVFNPQTLFPPNWEALKKYRCPLCGNLLKFPQGKKISMCDSNKHRPFVLRNELLIKMAI